MALPWDMFPVDKVRQDSGCLRQECYGTVKSTATGSLYPRPCWSARMARGSDLAWKIAHHGRGGVNTHILGYVPGRQGKTRQWVLTTSMLWDGEEYRHRKPLPETVLECPDGARLNLAWKIAHHGRGGVNTHIVSQPRLNVIGYRLKPKSSSRHEGILANFL